MNLFIMRFVWYSFEMDYFFLVFIYVQFDVWVCGVCEYNFKDVDFMVLCDVMVVFMGVFGFGKFFLVFGMLYVELQWCYLELVVLYVW